MIKKMVGDGLTLKSNSEIDWATLPSCFCNLFPHIYRFNHRLAFHKLADEPFIEVSNPYDDKQGIWQAGPILPSALVDIVAIKGGVEDTSTFEAKAND